MTDRLRERLHSVGHAATDLSRWALQMALLGRISSDRLDDIERTARRIADLAAKMREEDR